MKKEMMMDLDKMEAERGEIKETTREEMQALAMETAEACFKSTLEGIGKRLTQKRRADVMGALYRVRLHLIRNADTTAKDVRAAIKVLRIVEETGRTEATAMEFMKMANDGEWKHVPDTLRALLNRLGYFVDYDDAEETTETTTGGTTETTETTTGWPTVITETTGGTTETTGGTTETTETTTGGTTETTETTTGWTTVITETTGGTTETTEQPAEASESTQSDRARSAYLNTCDECEAIEATGTREAVHEAKKLRTLAAEALAHFLRTRSPEWVEELETLQREAFAYSPDGLHNQRSEAQGIGYHPRD